MYTLYGKEIDLSILKDGYDIDVRVARHNKARSLIETGSIEILRACPVCFSTDVKELQKVFSYLYKQCICCGSVFLSDVPSEKAMEVLHSSNEYSEDYKKLLSRKEVGKRIRTIGIPKADFIMKNVNVNKKTVLDIGCGLCEVGIVLKNCGAKYIGLETNSTVATFMKDNYNLDIRTSYYSSENSLSEKIDLILMFNILEHIPNPSGMLSSFSSMQKLGDHIVCEVPRVPSISLYTDILFPELVHRFLHPPYHVVLYSDLGLDMLFSRYGYVPVAKWMYGLDFIQLYKVLEKKLEGFKNSLLATELYKNHEAIQKVFDEKNLGDYLLGIYVKE